IVGFCSYLLLSGRPCPTLRGSMDEHVTKQNGTPAHVSEEGSASGGECGPASPARPQPAPLQPAPLQPSRPQPSPRQVLSGAGAGIGAPALITMAGPPPPPSAPPPPP